MELPEGVVAPESEDPHGGFGGQLGVRMKREGLVLPDDANLVGAVFLLDLLHRRREFRTVGALEVGELDNRDGSGPRPPHRIVTRNWDGGLFIAPRAGL